MWLIPRAVSPHPHPHPRVKGPLSLVARQAQCAHASVTRLGKDVKRRGVHLRSGSSTPHSSTSAMTVTYQTILITGAGGWLGSLLPATFVQREPETSFSLCVGRQTPAVPSPFTDPRASSAAY